MNNKEKNMPFVSPSNKLFNECRERCSRIIFVQFWHTWENVQYCHLYIYVQQCLITVNFSILLWTMIDFVWKCIWLFLRLTIKMLSKLFSRDTHILWWLFNHETRHSLFQTSLSLSLLFHHYWRKVQRGIHTHTHT